MVSGIAFGKERMRIRIVPYSPHFVEILAPHGKVDDLDDAVREEEEGDRVGREIIDIGALDYQIHSAQTELQQQQEQIHLERIVISGCFRMTQIFEGE